MQQGAGFHFWRRLQCKTLECFVDLLPDLLDVRSSPLYAHKCHSTELTPNDGVDVALFCNSLRSFRQHSAVMQKICVYVMLTCTAYKMYDKYIIARYFKEIFCILVYCLSCICVK